MVRDLYTGSATKYLTPHGWTDDVAFVGRGTIQGDTLSPLIFILSIEPLLRWLDVGGRGYTRAGGERVAGLAYADDLAVLAGSASDMRVQVEKVEAQ